MRLGELDLCVDWIPAEGERFVHRRLFDDGLIFLARVDHPRATPRMDAEALRAERFVRVHPRAGTHSDQLRVLREAAARLEICWVLEVSEFLEVPYVVMTTDLLGFVPASMRPTASGTGLLQVLELPLPPVPVPIFLVWHETRRSDDGHRWLRDLVAEVVTEAVGAR
jgi:DNA-binding transcriptional LysR family regulator